MKIKKLIVGVIGFIIFTACSSSKTDDKNLKTEKNSKSLVKEQIHDDEEISKKNEFKEKDAGKTEKIKQTRVTKKKIVSRKKKRKKKKKIAKKLQSNNQIKCTENYRKFSSRFKIYFKKYPLLEASIWYSNFSFHQKLKLKRYIKEHDLSIKDVYNDLKKSKINCAVYNDLKANLTKEEEKHFLKNLLSIKQIYEELRMLRKNKKLNNEETLRQYRSKKIHDKNKFIKKQEHFSIIFPNIESIDIEEKEDQLDRIIKGSSNFFKKVIENISKGNKIDHDFSDIEKEGLESGVEYLRKQEINVRDGLKEKILFIFLISKVLGFSLKDKVFQEFDRYRYYNNLFNFSSAEEIRLAFNKFFTEHVLEFFRKKSIILYETKMISILKPDIFFSTYKHKFLNNIDNKIKVRSEREKNFLLKLNDWIVQENDEIQERANNNLPLNFNLVVLIKNLREKDFKYDFKDIETFLRLNKQTINYCVLEYNIDYILKNLNLNTIIKEAAKKKVLLKDKTKDRFEILIDLRNIGKDKKVKIFVFQPPIKFIQGKIGNNDQKIERFEKLKEYAKYESAYVLYLKDKIKYKHLEEDYHKYNAYLSVKDSLKKYFIFEYRLDSQKIKYKYTQDSFLEKNMYTSSMNDLFITKNKESNNNEILGGNIISNQALIISKTFNQEAKVEIRFFYKGEDIKISDKDMLKDLLKKMII